MKNALAFLCLILAAVCFSGVSAEESNRVKNPSFEEVRDGRPADWSMNTRSFSIVEESARTGAKCLKYVNTDPSHYDFTSQRLDFEPGDVFLFSCSIKTEKIEGPDHGATLCIQWSDKDGKYIAGSFPNGITGTRGEWTRVEGRTAPMPENAANVSISLYVRREMTGTAWFDDVTVEKYHPPLLGVITTDRYRQITDGGTVGVSVGINARKTLSAVAAPKLTVTGGGLAEPMTLAASEIRPDEALFSFDSTPLPAGQYTLDCSAVHPETGASESVRLTMTRVEKLPERKAYIDSHRRLILDGKPFFPLGLYFGAVPDNELEIYADSAFNCIMPYARIKRETLDKIDARGVKVIYSVKDLYDGASGLQSVEAADEAVTKTVEELKDHPAIIAWYINDEYPLTRLPELVGRRDLMERLDPGRPTWAVLYQIESIREYLPTFDVAGTDPYPIAGKPVSMAYDWSVRTNVGMFDKKAVWQVPQIFDWSLHKKTLAERQRHRAPTGREMRAMYWMGIAGGANGLIAYCWHDLWFMDRGPSDKPRSPLVRKPFEQSWSELKGIAREIADSFDILLSVDEPMKLKLEESETPTVGLRLYGVGSTTWALLVNLTEEPQTVSLSAESPARVVETRLADRDAVTADGAKISVRLDALEPILVGLEKAVP